MTIPTPATTNCLACNGRTLRKYRSDLPPRLRIQPCPECQSDAAHATWRKYFPLRDPTLDEFRKSDLGRFDPEIGY